MTQDHAWFTHDRFGMFVHWGLYALPARHEWVMHREQTRIADYERYLRYFEADLYDPEEWAETAKNAGMKYVVLTTKHHEGFCLWDSALTDYKITNTPHGKDAIGPYVEALRAAGLKVGFYHSLIDWHHPDYTIDMINPRREDDDIPEQNKGRDMARYREYLHGQVRELLTNYGQIDYLFFDFSYPGRDHPNGGAPGKGHEDWDSDTLMALCRELQPNIVINDRLDIPGDLVTPDGSRSFESKPVKDFNDAGDCLDIASHQQAAGRLWITQQRPANVSNPRIQLHLRAVGRPVASRRPRYEASFRQCERVFQQRYL